MLGILLLIAFSYLVLRYFCNNFNHANFIPGKSALTEFTFGLLWPIAYFSVFEFTVAWLVHNPYLINQHFTYSDFANRFIYITKSVIYEELLFRGVFFYLVWKKRGTNYAILISSVCFGIYHWFAWQVFGNVIQMLTVFITTGTVGYLLALAFVRTRSMVLPIALHLGANLILMLVFSKDQSIGQQLLVKSFVKDPVVPPAIISLPVIIIHFVGYQCFTLYLLLRYLHNSEKSKQI